MHALCHSVRLTCESWPDTAKLVNSTISWTGDLGTESRITNYRGSLKTLFGNWIEDVPDVPMEEEPDPDNNVGNDDAHMQFDFQHDGGEGDGIVFDMAEHPMPAPHLVEPGGLAGLAVMFALVVLSGPSPLTFPPRPKDTNINTS